MYATFVLDPNISALELHFLYGAISLIRVYLPSYNVQHANVVPTYEVVREIMGGAGRYLSACYRGRLERCHVRVLLFAMRLFSFWKLRVLFARREWRE